MLVANSSLYYLRHYYLPYSVPYIILVDVFEADADSIIRLIILRLGIGLSSESLQ